MKRSSLSRNQRTWLRRICAQGYFGMGNATVASLERLGLIERFTTKDRTLSFRWQPTVRGRELEQEGRTA